MATQTRAHDGALTARQVEILELVALGLTNPQIAGRLFVSENTVRTHVRRIYRLLGLTNRVGATRWWRDHYVAAPAYACVDVPVDLWKHVVGALRAGRLEGLSQVTDRVLAFEADRIKA